MRPRLTISIVTYNAGEDIRLCLYSLLKQTEQNFELIVVDNNSSDDTLHIVEGLFPSALVVESKSNLGFGAGHNIAIHRAKSDWVLVLNQDVELEPDAIEQLLHCTAVSNIGCIGPLLYRKNGLVDTTGLEKSWHYSVVDRDRGNEVSRIKQDSDFVWGISGACALYRLKALNQVAYARKDRDIPEYFDESFFMYKEDVDLAARLNAHGWRSWFAHDSRGMHDRTGASPATILETASHRANQPDYIKEHSYKNHLYFLIKNVPIIAILPVLFYEFLKFFYLAYHERSTLKQLQEVKKKLPLMFKRRYV